MSDIMTDASRSSDEVLELLRASGARRLRAVRLRSNRSTVWSLTRGGSQLNLHRAFAAAPEEVLEDLAVIARAGGLAVPEAREASRRVSEWAPLHRELERIRAEPRRAGRPVGPCCATSDQLGYLRRMYRYLNRSRFAGRLPGGVPIRLSGRMKSRLGHMKPCVVDGRRRVLEIAINADLMLSGNDDIRHDTLVHEMAHAADWLFDGEVGHGPTWQWWATYAGCESRACTTSRIRQTPQGSAVSRVPPLPLAARVLLDADG
ncbi:MAG TPA: SprT family zinc-dependent metalloprotease [Longimicrobiales bacterium]|nr:SprT family zinc-dependent metalloprotease [Longimicrobiales bacterium]